MIPLAFSCAFQRPGIPNSQRRVVRWSAAEESEGIAAWIPQGEEGLTSAAGICERLQSEPTTLTDKELKRLVSRVPQVLGYDPSTLVPSLGALAARLDLSNDELKKKIVLRLPQICGYRFQEDVEPGLLALQEALGLNDTELRQLVLGLPQILGLDFQEEILPKIGNLRKEIAMLPSNGGAFFMAASAVPGSQEEQELSSQVRQEVLRKPSVLGVEVRGSKQGAAQ